MYIEQFKCLENFDRKRIFIKTPPCKEKNEKLFSFFYFRCIFSVIKLYTHLYNTIKAFSGDTFFFICFFSFFCVPPVIYNCAHSIKYIMQNQYYYYICNYICIV